MVIERNYFMLLCGYLQFFASNYIKSNASLVQLTVQQTLNVKRKVLFALLSEALFGA